MNFKLSEEGQEAYDSFLRKKDMKRVMGHVNRKCRRP